MSVTASTMSYLVLAGTTAATAYEYHEQGVQTDNMNKQKARVEQQTETGKQITMRQNMLRALAAQNAGTLGSVGTGANSGFGANTMRQIKQNQNDLAVSNANESAQVSLLDQAGVNAEQAGNVKAIDSVGDSFGKYLNGG